MKTWRSLLACSLLALMPWGALGQNNLSPGDPVSPSLAPRQREGRVLPLAPPVKPDPVPLAAVATRPERPALSAEVNEKLQSFQRVREAYLKQQEEIRKQMKNATDADREKVRQQLKDLRERWLEQSRSYQQELRDRQRELLSRLPSHREVIENSREKVRETIRDRRDRRGVDQ
jgi:hypothetical protein